MSNNYKEQKDKYLSKINMSDITFTDSTLEIIRERINYYMFLKNILKEEYITRLCNFNSEIQINIKIGNTVYKYFASNNALITYNDIIMVVDVDNLNKLVKTGKTEIDMSASFYIDIINNSIILGYIFMLGFNKKIKFNSINRLFPYVKKIVEMVFKENGVKINYDDHDVTEEPQEIEYC